MEAIVEHLVLNVPRLMIPMVGEKYGKEKGGVTGNANGSSRTAF